MAKVADAVGHAHEHGVIHRDLKPANVLVDRSGRVFVTDFGFAWLEQEFDSRDSSVVGTVGYMAPEQIDRSLGPIGPHTDVFGLGALLSMLCCGEAQGGADSVPHAARDGTHAGAISESLPPELKRILARCLRADWRERFATAAELASALRAFAAAD